MLTSAGLALAALGCMPSSQQSWSQTDYILHESEAVNAWFDDRFQDELARSPMSQTKLGLKSNLGRLDDVSQQALDEQAALLRGWKQDLARSFDEDRLVNFPIMSIFSSISLARIAACPP